MIVVDTTVWIDFFNDVDEPHVRTFVDLIEADAGIALTDVVLTEILQGLREDRQVAVVEGYLAPFDVLRLESLGDFRRAAALYRSARRQGVTVRRTLDCLIASVCVRDGVPLLHNDADFDRLAACTELLIHPSGA